MSQKKITHNSIMFFYMFSFVFIQQACTNHDTSKDCSNIFNGYDTTIYKVVYQKDGNFILSKKDYQVKFASGDHIDPKVAFGMIESQIRLAQDVDASHILTDKASKYVTFDMNRLIDFYTELESLKKTPDSLRIYFGIYNDAPSGRSAEYINRMSCILVGVKADNDIYDPNNAKETKLWPINIGTLCPPDCNRTTKITDYSTGPIFLKKGAVMAGANKW